MIDRQFEELKEMHGRLFGDGAHRTPYDPDWNDRAYDYFVGFVKLVASPDFRARTSIAAVLSRWDEFSESQLGQAHYESAATTLFLEWHRSDVHDSAALSLCAAPGPMARINDLTHLRNSVVGVFKKRAIDDWRARQVRTRYEDAVRPIATGRGAPVEDEEPGLDPEIFTPEDFETAGADDTGDLPGEVASGDSDLHIVEEVSGFRGIRVMDGEPRLQESDQKACAEAARIFFTEKLPNEPMRQRLGVWAAFHLARNGTFHRGGRHAATESGYAREAERLGFGRASLVSGTINRSVGVGRLNPSSRARAATTAKDRFFQQRGWAPSADDSRPAAYWKALLEIEFRLALARIASEHLLSHHGVTPQVPEYRA